MGSTKLIDFLKTQEAQKLMNEMNTAVHGVLSPHIMNNDNERFVACLFKLSELGKIAEATLSKFGITLIVEKENISDEKPDSEN